MKRLITLILILFSLYVDAQIYILSKESTYLANKWPDGLWEKFKKTTTVFVFTDAFEEEVYRKILKESWKVTPYLLLSSENLTSSDLTKEGYSFAFLRLLKASDVRVYTIFQIGLFNSIEILDKLNNIPYSKRGEKMNELLNREFWEIAGIFLYHNQEFYEEIKKPSIKVY